MITRAWKKWRSGYMGRLVGESFYAQGPLYGIAILAMIVVAITTAGSAYMMEYIVDAMTSPELRGWAQVIALAVVLLFLTKAVASYVQSTFLARAGNRIVAQQQEKVYRKLLRHGVSYFSANESSDLLMRTTNGAQAARSLIDVLVTSFVRDALTLVGLVVVMVYQQPVLSVMFFVVGPIALLGVRYLLKSVRSIMQAEFKSLAEIIRVLQETSAGIKVIKVFSLEDRMIDRMETAIRKVEQRSNDIARLQAIASPLMEFLAGLAVAGVLIVSTMGIAGSEQPSAGQLMSFITALLMAYEPAKRLSRMRVQIETNMIGVGLLFSLLDSQDTMVESPDARDLKAGPGHIALRDVTFGYQGAMPVIENMSVTFEAGKTTALVGQSGGGKSTLFGLIMRFYDPDGGVVEIDGQDLRDVSFASLRRKISYVGQDTFLFSASIMDNLRCSAPEATDEEVFEAAKAAHAHDFIMELKDGYDTQVGENGTFLSGGQKQRIAIARAILRNAEILLLDEATSALDAESESLVKKALDALTQNVTVIVIAHRLSTVLEADKIIVVQDGAIVEQGNLDELMKKSGSFRTLFDQQFKKHTPTKEVAE
ncbi:MULTISPECIES: ABC transporter ATP-binding protein [unclassified Ruegeria]|uniref:ABC transporter ATP-binding protein n=1 Tax=unclassified Ruegeria TaxID=2625375 RepID=UPI0014930645|nr:MULTISPECIES: ABC transporter ATP-binding protein [unclassified Ruegeria]NOD47582.1 ATP-binding cassette domain-containing protein [Ruegeria sp. HKCCD5849]NOD52755.1 ATP-binding cassette domain-containing protein [Ruegeria sp. HKCCD5851]NOD66174.1 ATP-binding cassette domain-containing protein [Ruegeria sp. HKCCD7303]